MQPELLIEACAPIIRNWFESPDLKSRTDPFGRSVEFWMNQSRKNQLPSMEIYGPDDHAVDDSVAKQCFAALADVRARTPAFFKAFDYEWAFDARSYLTLIEGGHRMDSQSLRGQVFLLQALAEAWKVHDSRINPLSFGNICVRRVTEVDAVPRCIQHGPFRYVIISDEFRMQILTLLGSLRASVGSLAADPPHSVMERLCSSHTEATFANLPLVVLPRHIAREFKIEARPWDLALLCLAEQQLGTMPAFKQTQLGVFPPSPGSIEVELIDPVMAFFLYHEAAHLLHNHSAERSLEREVQADSLALALFFVSRGWRYQGAVALRVDDLEWALLGPMFYLWAVTSLARLDSLVAPKSASTGLAAHQAEIEERQRHLFARIAATAEAIIHQTGSPLPTESHRRLTALAATLKASSDSFLQTEALEQIVTLARDSLQTWSATL